MFLNAVTMHRIGRDGLLQTLQSICLSNNIVLPKPGDFVLIVCGEVDCRCHIQKQIAQGLDEDVVLQDLSNRYLNALLGFRNEFQVDIGVRGVVPPLKDGDHQHHDVEYPIRGSDQDRLRWQQKLNALLENGCKTYGLLFVPSPVWTAGEDMFMKRDYSDGIIHISDRYSTEATSEFLALLNEFRPRIN